MNHTQLLGGPTLQRALNIPRNVSQLPSAPRVHRSTQLSSEQRTMFHFCVFVSHAPGIRPFPAASGKNRPWGATEHRKRLSIGREAEGVIHSIYRSNERQECNHGPGNPAFNLRPCRLTMPLSISASNMCC